MNIIILLSGDEYNIISIKREAIGFERERRARNALFIKSCDKQQIDNFFFLLLTHAFRMR